MKLLSIKKRKTKTSAHWRSHQALDGTAWLSLHLQQGFTTMEFTTWWSREHYRTRGTLTLWGLRGLFPRSGTRKSDISSTWNMWLSMSSKGIDAEIQHLRAWTISSLILLLNLPRHCRKLKDHRFPVFLVLRCRAQVTWKGWNAYRL